MSLRLSNPAGAGEPAPRRLPLRLCEVLEREFGILHGHPSQPADWLLADGDVDFEALADCLRDAARGSADEAIGTIAAKVVQAGLRPTSEGALTADGRAALRGVLNDLLQAREPLYRPGCLDPHAEARRLAEQWFAGGGQNAATDGPGRPSTRGGPSEAPMPASEHVLVNRLLLEAVLPEQIVARADTVRLGQLFDAVHGLQARGQTRSALCLSGGGIRSAAFSLGILQSLARLGLLDRFDYLSTVSGGGYAGSWLSTWISRHPRGLAGVIQELGATARSETGGQQARLEPSARPVDFLRSYSHFLNPRAGLFSADTWTWVGLYLRNLSLSWLFVIPLLLAVLALPRVYAAFARLAEQAERPVDPFVFWLATLSAILVIVCVTVNRPSVTDAAEAAARTASARAAASRGPKRLLERFKRQQWVLALGVAPLVLFSVLVTLLIWSVPPGTRALDAGQAYALLAGSLRAGSPLAAIGAILPNLALSFIPAWGELIVLAGWLASIVLVPRYDWSRRLAELGAMLLAGLLTWGLVAAWAGHAYRLLDGRAEGVRLLSFTLYPAHLYAILAVPAVILAILAGMTVFIGIMSKPNWIEDEDREWWARFGAWVLVAMTAWLALSAIALLGPPLLMESPRLLAALGGASGLVAVLLGKSSLSPGVPNKESAAPKGAAQLLASAGVNLLALVAAVFLAVFLALLSLAGSAMLATAFPAPPGYQCGLGAGPPALGAADLLSTPQLHLEIVCQTPWQRITAVTVGLLALLTLANFLFNLNKFSLHAAYRIRIIRTFLGASRGDDRRPNAFTGFDPLDNIQMHELQPGLLREADIRGLGGLVDALSDALAQGGPRPDQSAAGVLAHWMCSKRHDPAGELRSRLAIHQHTRQVTKSLQRNLVQTCNRVLETQRLDAAEPFRRLLDREVDGRPARDAVELHLRHGNLVFANRVLLQLAFEPHIACYEFPPPPPHKLLHVINLTLNLVSGGRLAWQERKAAPFSVTPMHAGSYYLGYRESRDYGGKDGISIGTAAAVSGAAVSPNMGYSSSPLTALVLALFNVRLGWWLGNPGLAGADTYARAEPRFSLRPLLSEALGLTDDESPYVYLSDGGHFDNLGLFEMVLRRCRLIVAVDASGDPMYRFGDLGNAIRKIRIDLGIPIEFASMPIRRFEADGSGDGGNGGSGTDGTGGNSAGGGRYCAIGRIRYGCVDGDAVPDGVLVYFKPVLRGTEPRDVLHYAAQNARFPHESTLDQFFGESQFESYRQLGESAMRAACGPARDLADAPWPDGFIQAVRDHVGEPAGP